MFICFRINLNCFHISLFSTNLIKKLEAWEKYNNLHRPHSSHKGFTPYEVLKVKLENRSIECQS